jgi:hypothetical protein
MFHFGRPLTLAQGNGHIITRQTAASPDYRPRLRHHIGPRHTHQHAALNDVRVCLPQSRRARAWVGRVLTNASF